MSISFILLTHTNNLLKFGKVFAIRTLQTIVIREANGVCEANFKIQQSAEQMPAIVVVVDWMQQMEIETERDIFCECAVVIAE